MKQLLDSLYVYSNKKGVLYEAQEMKPGKYGE
jgi:hypothetical protein